MVPPKGFRGVRSVKLRTCLRVGSTATAILAGVLLLLSLHAFVATFMSIAEEGVKVDSFDEEGLFVVRLSLENGGLIPIDAYASATLGSDGEVISQDYRSLRLSPGESGEISLSVEIPGNAQFSRANAWLELAIGFEMLGRLTCFEVRSLMRG